MNSDFTRLVLLQTYSLLVTGLLFLSIFGIYTGLVGWSYLLPVLVAIGSAVAVRYVVLYHRFSRSTYRWITLVFLASIHLVSVFTALTTACAEVSFGEIQQVFIDSTFSFEWSSFLPRWWIVALLFPACLLVIIGVLATRELTPYPKPVAIDELAQSPAYFGLVCAIFGLWAVLFVGFRLQRVIVIAPLFEELLKFGIALLLGSVLFDRSLAARVGVALAVGSGFGMIEHATTYPMEADTVYLHRTLFHTVTTALSVSVYTVFESRSEDALRWIAPAYSILFHFFYNTFAVGSAVIGVLTVGGQQTALTLAYGLATMLAVTGLMLLVLLRQQAIVAIHRPLEYVLSDLV